MRRTYVLGIDKNSQLMPYQYVPEPLEQINSIARTYNTMNANSLVNKPNGKLLRYGESATECKNI